MATEIVSAQQLREVLHYCPETGVFTRLVRTSSRANVGDVAGSKNGLGYIRFSVLDRVYLAHRLAWLHVHGVWPVGQIDHRDGVRSNNALANLRDASRSVNAQNLRRAHSNSSHGWLGVSRSRNRWVAKIMVDGRNRYLGTFTTPELASAAYIDAKRRLHDGCTI